MTNCIEIVGYTNDGRALCPACMALTAYSDVILIGEWYPIFAGSEWDTAPTCDICHCVIDVCTIEMEASE